MKKIFLCFCLMFFLFSVNTFSDAQTRFSYIKVLERNSNNSRGDVQVTYAVYLDTTIREPSVYRELFYLLDYAKKKDTIILKINTYGGNAWTATQLYNSIKNTRAKVIAEIYVAYSAGGIIAMACDEIVVTKFSTMMIHSLQMGYKGNVSSVKTVSTFIGTVSSKIISEAFKDFLSDKEINDISDGNTLWLYEDEIKKRLKK